MTGPATEEHRLHAPAVIDAMRSRARLAALLACCLLACLAGAQSAGAAFGDARIFAPYPSHPGSPEGIVVRDGVVYVSGGTAILRGSNSRSTIIAYDRATGAVVRRYEDPAKPHATSGIAFDRAGRLYVLGGGFGMFRLDVRTGAREPYAPPPADLKPCVVLLVAPPCSPTVTDSGPGGNELAFAPNGDAYFSDSGQATIWRVPAGGGRPRIWFQDPRLATAFVGVNGLRLDPTAKRVYMAVTIDLLGASLVYSLPLVRKPAARQLRLFHRLPVGEVPDGIAFGARGDLYVAIGAPQGQGIVVLRPDGTRRARLRNALTSPLAPWDGPADIAFDGSGSS